MTPTEYTIDPNKIARGEKPRHSPNCSIVKNRMSDDLPRGINELLWEQRRMAENAERNRKVLFTVLTAALPAAAQAHDPYYTTALRSVKIRPNRSNNPL